MAWTAITAAILKERKVAPLIDVAKNYAAGISQADPTESIIASAVSSIRAAVRSCTKYTVDADPDTIPSDLVDLACRMITNALKSFADLELTQDERDDKRADERKLERIAACELAVATTDNPEVTPSTQSQAATPRISQPTRRFTPGLQDGI